MLKTAQELAEMLVKIEHSYVDEQGTHRTLNYSDGEVRLLARRIRHFDTERLIVAAAEKRDARGTAQFDEIEACKVRLLSFFADFGFDKNLLSQVVGMVAPRASGILSGGGKKEYYWENPEDEAHHIKNLPDAIRRGEAWELVVKFNSQFGRKSVSGGFIIPSDADLKAQDVAEAEDASQAMRQIQKIELCGRLTLSASDLCAPVVAAYGEAA